MPIECTVYFRQPGNTPVPQPPGCAKWYTAIGKDRKHAVHRANAKVPLGCQGKGIGNYGPPLFRWVP